MVRAHPGAQYFFPSRRAREREPRGDNKGTQFGLGCRLFVFWYVVFKTPDSGGMMVPLVLNIFIDKNLDPGRTRTCNPLIRSQMPYPLGHRAGVSDVSEPKLQTDYIAIIE